MRSYSLRFIFLLIIFLSHDFCAYDSKSEETDTELKQSLVLLLLRSTDVTGACVPAQDAAIACTDLAGVIATFTYKAVLETTYRITIAAPRTSAEICSVLPSSPYYPNPLNDPASANYKTYSDPVKICILYCEKEYWTAMKSEGNCTSANYPSALTDSTHSLFMSKHTVYKTCNENCIIRGTLLPPLSVINIP